jgi:transcriptional regulator with XRE-family HTH domain
MSVYSSGVPMVKIDGSIVKSLRESKGLTQLYLATSVDVTTDTISRWENKRYPKIKKENALKLAEALEVTIDEILDHHEDTVPEIADNPGKQSGDDLKKAENVSPPKRVSAATWITAALLLAGMAWWFGVPAKKIEMAAVRIAPAHIIAGQPFPVVIRVNVDQVPSSFILKEIVPQNCSLAGTRPSGLVVDEKTGELKWIVKAKEPVVHIGYMLRSKTPIEDGDNLKFSGRITQRKIRGKGHDTVGQELTVVSSSHWADSDENGIIDDEEILAVYDDYNEIAGLELNMDLIEEIWFGNGYTWESSSAKFIVMQ